MHAHTHTHSDMDFEGLAAGRIIPPWTPTVVGSMDTSQFDLEFTSMLPVGEYNSTGREREDIVFVCLVVWSRYCVE